MRNYESAETAQAECLKRVRSGRDQGVVVRTLGALEAAARGRDNLMPYTLEAVEAYATLGEICNVMRRVFGEYQQPTRFV